MVFHPGMLKLWSIISIHGGWSLQLGVPALLHPEQLPRCCPEPTLLWEPVWATAGNIRITLSKQHGHITNGSSGWNQQLKAVISVQRWSKRQQIIICHGDSLCFPLLFFKLSGFPFWSMLNWRGFFLQRSSADVMLCVLQMVEGFSCSLRNGCLAVCMWGASVMAGAHWAELEQSHLQPVPGCQRMPKC